MKIFLWYMANPGFQAGVAEKLGIDQSTMSKTISSVMRKIIEKAHLWIFQLTLAKVNEAQQAWQEKFQFPIAIGIIDCTHVQILKPNHHGDECINKKGLATVNVQATSNSSEIFTNVDFPGAVLLLGDDGYGYGSEPWQTTSFINLNNASARAYNRLFKKERVIIIGR
ncbi:hypothetical protein NQ314_011345 [Rhamnusium bicolor]|uniref:Nuclease HARBI1 n=1 Tax=Rhamnusium bicolor TaxID=1586634 RepID=A0AAV8XJP3_9CUCU|nr:hypothetical protein NQ314_011345 [Rhamnusium bicolor]